MKTMEAIKNIKAENIISSGAISGNIPKRMTTAIINSLTAGVVPRIGLEHFAVGRKDEISAILMDLDNIENGAATFRFITGRFGSGKSFMLQIIRNYAMDRGFVVADVDLTPEKRLTGTQNQGLATYRELMQRVSVKMRPDGGALDSILQKWIMDARNNVIDVAGIQPGDAMFDSAVERNIHRGISELEGLAHGFDFANAVSAYWRGFSTGNDELKNAAIRWIRGEFTTKTEARKYLNVGEIITDDNWYDYIKLFARLIAHIGYKGLILFIDECVNLYKIVNRVSRENNYEKILTMFNDIMQGKAEHLGILMGSTPQFIEDERRGLYSYEALRSRLKENRFSDEKIVDLAGPIIRLKVLTDEEILVLLERLAEIHAKHFDYKSRITTENLISFLQLSMDRVGAGALITPREISRDFLGLLNILSNDESKDFETLVKKTGGSSENTAANPENPKDEFADFTL